MKTTLPEEIYLTPSDVISWNQFATKKAKEYNEAYKSAKLKLTPESVTQLAMICVSDEDLPDESPKELWLCLEDLCRTIEQSEELMTQETTEEPVTEASLEHPAKEAMLEPVEAPKEANIQELGILQAATSTGLHNGYAELSKKFEFGDTGFRLKADAIVSPADYGSMIGLGADMGSKGRFIVAKAYLHLKHLNQSDSLLEQIAASLHLNYSTICNWVRTLERTPEQYQGLPFTTLVELATPVYDKENPKADQEKREELFEQAKLENWDSQEARSHSKQARGHDDVITDGGKPVKYRFLQILGGEPMYCIEEPVWSEGVTIINLKTREVLKDIEKKLTWCKIAEEPATV